MKKKSLTNFAAKKVFLTTTLCCMEDEYMGYPGTV